MNNCGDSVEKINMDDVLEFIDEFRFLSNFWPCEVTFDGVTYPSIEHAYQAAKTLDLDAREKIRILDTAGKAKRVGKQVNLRSDWEEIRLGVMKDLVNQKFKKQNFLDELCKIKGKIAEGNNWGDTYWGVDKKGKGQNNLGKILMEIRDKNTPA